jgi:hypothetical protein
MSHVRPKSRLQRFVVFSLISLMVCMTVTVMLGYYFAADVARFMYLRKIGSGDPAQRQVGLSFMLRRIDDPLVVRDAAAMMEAADTQTFDAMVSALAGAGRWGPARFGNVWARYLIERVDRGTPDQRAAIAVELGRWVWNRKAHFDDPRVTATVAKLLGDAEAGVRLNALSAAASLADTGKRLELIRKATADAHPVVARHAWILLGLLHGVEADAKPPGDPAVKRAFDFATGRGTGAAKPTGPPEDAVTGAKELARLEAMATASVERIELAPQMPAMLRLQSVRVSKAATPEDLLPVFESKASAARDLAVLVSLERFTQEQNRELARTLIGTFDDGQRISGAVVAGMLPAIAVGEQLAKAIETRRDNPGGWVVQQFYNAALVLRGKPVAGFDPANLLLHEQVPKTTAIFVMLEMGRLDGLDWLVNPFGECPAGGDEGLRVLMDTLRFDAVVRRFIEGWPEFWVWGDAETQRFQLDVIRDWYLLNRPSLKFDPATGKYSPHMHTDSHR